VSIVRRHGRVLALVLAIVVLAAVLAGASSMVSRVREGRAQIEERLEQIARFERLALDARALEAAIADLDAGGRSAELLVSAPSDRVATAELQQMLKSTVGRAGGTLTSARVLESASLDAFRKVGIEVRASLGTRGLRDTLHQLEGGAPMLLVENLVIVSRRAPRRRGASTRAQTLDVRFRLVGFMPEPSSGADGTPEARP